MTDVRILADEVRRALDGDPWYGPSIVAVLSGVDSSAARMRPAGATHSIWELVRHMTAWANYVAYRVEGGAPGDPEEGDWPAIGSTDDASWRAAVAGLAAAHERLLTALSASTDSALDTVNPDTPLDDRGEPVTLYRAVAGVAQHDAYHCGQIAVLKQLIGAGRQ